jgi:hypothetical protein
MSIIIRHRIYEYMYLVVTKEFCQGFRGANPQNHPAALSSGILLRYRLSGNSHPGSPRTQVNFSTPYPFSPRLSQNMGMETKCCVSGQG